MGFVSYRDEQREGRPEQRLLGKDQLCLLGRQLGGSRLGVRALRIQGTLEHLARRHVHPAKHGREAADRA